MIGHIERIRRDRAEGEGGLGERVQRGLDEVNPVRAFPHGVMMVQSVLVVVAAGVIVLQIRDGEIGVFGLLVTLGIIALLMVGVWVYKVLEMRFGPRAIGLRDQCISCGYDLTGLDSVLGEEIWVGPERCPECGKEYPAVG